MEVSEVDEVLERVDDVEEEDVVSDVVVKLVVAATIRTL